MTTPPGEIVITKNEVGHIVAVTRQDEEGRILDTLAISEPIYGPWAERAWDQFVEAVRVDAKAEKVVNIIGSVKKLKPMFMRAATGDKE